MIEFHFEKEVEISDTDGIGKWIADLILNESYRLDTINYIFCSDEDLLKRNVEFLKHDTLTDIISFDYTMGKLIAGDIFISVERIEENATEFGVTFLEELHRVMAHGVLHYCGYKDKTPEDKKEMRMKEDYYLSLRKI
ncbi:MAG: rRNA maturation RNase YbeY [Flavobacteriaceae bacterium]|nr:MAG: rRNA maturation RNase YbeY [Flavobacteriaceae bacterium]